MLPSNPTNNAAEINQNISPHTAVVVPYLLRQYRLIPTYNHTPTAPLRPTDTLAAYGTCQHIYSDNTVFHLQINFDLCAKFRYRLIRHAILIWPPPLITVTIHGRRRARPPRSKFLALLRKAAD